MNNSFCITPRTFWRVVAGGVFGIALCALVLIPLVRYRQLSSIAKIVPVESSIIITVRPSGNPFLPTPISTLPLQSWWHTADEWLGNEQINFYDDVVKRAKQITVGVWFDEARIRHAVIVAEFFSSRTARAFAEQHDAVKYISGSTVMIPTDDVARQAAERSLGEPLTAARIPSGSLNTDSVSVTIFSSAVLSTSTNEFLRTSTPKSWHITLNTKNIQPSFLLKLVSTSSSSSNEIKNVDTTTVPALSFFNVSLASLSSITSQVSSETQTIISVLQNIGAEKKASISTPPVLTASKTMSVLFFADTENQTLIDYVLVLPIQSSTWSAEEFEKDIASAIAFRWPSINVYELPDQTTINELVADSSAVRWMDGKSIVSPEVAMNFRQTIITKHDFVFSYVIHQDKLFISNNPRALVTATTLLSDVALSMVPSCGDQEVAAGAQAGSVVVHPSSLPPSWQAFLPDASFVVEEVNTSNATGCIILEK